MLLDEALPHSPGRVALLGRCIAVGEQPLVDQLLEGTERRAGRPSGGFARAAGPNRALGGRCVGARRGARRVPGSTALRAPGRVGSVRIAPPSIPSLLRPPSRALKEPGRSVRCRTGWGQIKRPCWGQMRRPFSRRAPSLPRGLLREGDRDLVMCFRFVLAERARSDRLNRSRAARRHAGASSTGAGPPSARVRALKHEWALPLGPKEAEPRLVIRFLTPGNSEALLPQMAS